ncbi:MAG: hypothetical protein AAF845_05735 [Bacteroidota bacterium]
MSAPRYAVTLADLVALAAGSSSIVDAAADHNPEAPERSVSALEYRAATDALEMAERLGTQWLGYTEAETLHVTEAEVSLRVYEALGVIPGDRSRYAARTSGLPLVELPVTPETPPDVVGAVVARGGRVVLLPASAPGLTVTTTAVVGYAPRGLSRDGILAIGAADGSALADLDPASVVPEVPGPLVRAVCETALFVLHRAEKGLIGAEAVTTTTGGTSTTRTAPRLADINLVIGRSNEVGAIWRTYASGFRAYHV